MKKKILLLIPLIVLFLCLISCKGCKKEEAFGIQNLINSVYDSEAVIAGYTEVNSIYDGDFEVYSKETEYIIQRTNVVKSEVKIREKKLSTSGDKVYDETTTSFKTADSIKYVEINGTTYETDYVMPTYYLTFVITEEYLEEGYKIEVVNGAYKLTAKVLDNRISSFFLNKSLGNVTNLNIEIIIKDNLLQSFNANYISANGKIVKIETKYNYGVKGEAKAVFYLEGGECKNSKDRISYVYNFDGSKMTTLIIDPNILETDPINHITKSGYHIEGWYQNKIEHPDGSVEYTDKWDFSKDKMTIDGVTLYAKWEINRVYSYELYYFDEDGNEQFLDSYIASEGEKFNDIFLDNTTIEGYTSLGYMSEDGSKWDEDFVHPGGDSDVAIKVYLNLIKGEYSIVKTTRQFRSAIAKNQNIYLLNDIDYDGDEICFDSYSGIILGNGHKISNFLVDYDSTKSGLKGALDDIKGSNDHLYISLFFELKDVEIKDLTFENVIIDIDTNYRQIKYLIIAPLAIIANNVKLEKITFLQSDDKELNTQLFNTGDVHWISAGNVDTNKIINKKALQFSGQFGTTYMFFKLQENEDFFEEDSEISLVVSDEKVWNKKEFRNAVLEAFPWDEIRKNVSIPATTFVYPLAGYPPVNGFSYTDEVEAVNMMNEARRNNDIGEEEIIPLVFEVSTGFFSENQKQIMKNALLPLNVDLQIVEIHPAKYLRSVASSEADLFLYSWTGDFADPLAFLELFRGNSTLNDSNWKNEEFDRLISLCSLSNSRLIHWINLSKRSSIVFSS